MNSWPQTSFPRLQLRPETLRKEVHPLLAIDSSAKPEQYKDLVDKLHGSADQFTPNNIDQARIEFGQLSADLIAFLREFMPQLDDPLYTIKCPMWNKSPAVWLQDTTVVKNPFLGPDMADLRYRAGNAPGGKVDAMAEPLAPAKHPETIIERIIGASRTQSVLGGCFRDTRDCWRDLCVIPDPARCDS